MKWKIGRYLVLSVILFLITQKVVHSTIYFYLQEGSEKCFIQEVPKHVPIHVKYENVNNLGIQCVIVFKNPQKIEVYSRHVNEREYSGGVAYLPTIGGEHQICIRCESSNWFKSEQMKWKFSIDTGNLSEHLDINALASKDEADSIDQFIYTLINKVNNLISEGEYEFEKQEKFLHRALKVNYKIIVFSIIQILLIIIITFFSIIHMKSFLRKQRLI